MVRRARLASTSSNELSSDEDRASAKKNQKRMTMDKETKILLQSFQPRRVTRSMSRAKSAVRAEPPPPKQSHKTEQRNIPTTSSKILLLIVLLCPELHLLIAFRELPLPVMAQLITLGLLLPELRLTVVEKRQKLSIVKTLRITTLDKPMICRSESSSCLPTKRSRPEMMPLDRTLKPSKTT
uniref:Uncharacterized protein n=1 Tax=Ditylenchus dipsaci TaxID=166011 RepID=A0A915DXL6_9BILA